MRILLVEIPGRLRWLLPMASCKNWRTWVIILLSWYDFDQLSSMPLVSQTSRARQSEANHDTAAFVQLLLHGLKWRLRQLRPSRRPFQELPPLYHQRDRRLHARHWHPQFHVFPSSLQYILISMPSYLFSRSPTCSVVINICISYLVLWKFSASRWVITCRSNNVHQIVLSWTPKVQIHPV